MNARTPGRRLLARLLPALFSLGLLAAVYAALDGEALRAAFAAPSPLWLALALLLSVPQMALSAWRWQLTAASLDAPLPFRHAFAEYYLGSFLNQVLPGGVLGDANRAWRHARRTVVANPAHDARMGTISRPALGSDSDSGSGSGLVFSADLAARTSPRSSAWLAVLLERSSGQAAMLLCALATLLLSPTIAHVLGALSGRLQALGMSPAPVALGLGAGLLLVLVLRRSPLLHTFTHAVRRALLAPALLWRHLLTSLALATSYIAVYFCCTRMLGIDTPASILLALIPWVLLAMALPLSMAGWGLREGAAAVLWAAAGLDVSQGVAISIAYGIVVLTSTLPGAWVLLRRGA